MKSIIFALLFIMYLITFHFLFLTFPYLLLVYMVDCSKTCTHDHFRLKHIRRVILRDISRVGPLINLIPEQILFVFNCVFLPFSVDFFLA